MPHWCIVFSCKPFIGPWHLDPCWSDKSLSFQPWSQLQPAKSWHLATCHFRHLDASLPGPILIHCLTLRQGRSESFMQGLAGGVFYMGNSVGGSYLFKIWECLAVIFGRSLTISEISSKFPSGVLIIHSRSKQFLPESVQKRFNILDCHPEYPPHRLG